jgi:hypothetical protein
MDRVKLKVSFFEIYNEKIYDLLSNGTKKGSGKVKDGLELREEKNGYFSVVDLKRVDVESLDDAY